MARTPRKSAATLTVAATLVMGLLAVGQPLGAAAQSSADPMGVDDGTHITMWSRAAT